jgi:hypothetical protein
MRPEKELITKSEEYIKYIRSLCDREVELDPEDVPFDTMYFRPVADMSSSPISISSPTR